MDPITFGRELIRTGDLDPVYIGLHGAGFPEDQLKRWFVAYGCYYHAGVACWLSAHAAPKDFWHWVIVAATNNTPCPAGGRWPRMAERRHYRGAAAVSSATYLSGLYSDRPETMIDYIASPGTLSGIMARTAEHPLFGPWIGFKFADMIDRVLGVPVTFDAAEVLMFDQPAISADILSKRWRRSRLNVMRRMVMEYRDIQAPPRFERPIGIPEVETVLCKWKSHIQGRYFVGKDIKEVRHALSGWEHVSADAKQMLQAIPKEVEEDGSRSVASRRTHR